LEEGDGGRQKRGQSWEEATVFNSKCNWIMQETGGKGKKRRKKGAYENYEGDYFFKDLAQDILGVGGKTGWKLPRKEVERKRKFEMQIRGKKNRGGGSGGGEGKRTRTNEDFTTG